MRKKIINNKHDNEITISAHFVAFLAISLSFLYNLAKGGGADGNIHTWFNTWFPCRCDSVFRLDGNDKQRLMGVML